MIQIINGHSTTPDVEILTAISPGNFDCDIEYSDLDAGEKLTYDNAMGVLVQDSICNVVNTPYELSIQRMTSNAINEGVDEMTESGLDYTALTTEQQGILDAFNQLLIDKCW